jgi:DNA-binding LytR/AlgR family response regulator
MGKNNYKIIIPFTQSQDLELSSRLLDKQLESGISNMQLESKKEATTGNTFDLSLSEENPNSEKIQTSMLRVIKSAQQVFSHILSNQRVFIVTTPTGIQLVKLEQILYFEYSNPKKQWVLFLTDQTSVLLKRKTNARDIIELTPTLFKISQQHIINLEHLKAIDDKTCKFSVPTPGTHELIISRNYLKLLQENIRMI